ATFSLDDRPTAERFGNARIDPSRSKYQQTRGADDGRFGSFATDRCAMKIGPRPQYLERDGWPSKRRRSRWANCGHSGVLAIDATKAMSQPSGSPALRSPSRRCLTSLGFL